LAEPVELQNTTDFLQIKTFVQKIGTNHHLQNKKALFDLKEPYDLVPKYKERICKPSQVGGWLSSPSNHKNNSQISECTAWCVCLTKSEPILNRTDGALRAPRTQTLGRGGKKKGCGENEFPPRPRFRCRRISCQ